MQTPQVVQKTPDKTTQNTAEKANTKRGRPSGAAAIFALSESIDSVITTFNATAEGTTSAVALTSPQRKTAAIRAVEHDEELSDHEMVDVADLIRERTDIADTYLALTKKSTRTAYLQKQLAKYTQL